MKKFLLAVVALVAMVLPSQAQFDFGLRGGANFGNTSVKNLNPDNRSGFYVGPTVKFTLPIVGLSLDASALYDYRSAKIGDDGSEETVKQQQITVPINVRYGWGFSSLANVFVFVGPQFGFNVGSDKKLFDEAAEWTMKSSNFSMNVGLGATVLKHLEAKINYNFALGKTGDVSTLGAAEDIVKGKVRSNAWQLGLAYYF